jgi:Bacterial toxin YdaS
MMTSLTFKEISVAKRKKVNDILELIRERGLLGDVADACGIRRQAVSQWQEVPWNRVLEVERVTGVRRHLIRPDIYPAPVPRLKKKAKTPPRSLTKKFGAHPNL